MTSERRSDDGRTTPMSTTEERTTIDPTAVLDKIRQREQAIKDDEWTVVEAHGRDIADEGWSEVRITDQDGNPVAITYMTNVLEPGDDAEYTDFIAHSLTDMSGLLRVVERLRDLCRDTDGNWLEPSSSLPVGEFQAALALLSAGTVPGEETAQ